MCVPGVLMNSTIVSQSRLNRRMDGRVRVFFDGHTAASTRRSAYTSGIMDRSFRSTRCAKSCVRTNGRNLYYDG